MIGDLHSPAVELHMCCIVLFVNAVLSAACNSQVVRLMLLVFLLRLVVLKVEDGVLSFF